MSRLHSGKFYILTNKMCKIIKCQGIYISTLSFKLLLFHNYLILLISTTEGVYITKPLTQYKPNQRHIEEQFLIPQIIAKVSVACKQKSDMILVNKNKDNVLCIAINP